MRQQCNMVSIFKHIKLNKSIALVILLAVSALTHFAYFGHPAQTVFDEVHFGKFISGYYTHSYFFDIHPPLGKLVIAGFGKLFDFQPGFSFATIGDQFPDEKYKALRFLPSLAGTLLPLVVFLLAFELGLTLPLALLTGLLTTLEGGLLVQSRFILLDAFLLLFGFASLWSYLRWRNGGAKWFLISAGVLAGLAFSIKWTGLGFLGLIGIMELYHLWQDRVGTARRRLPAVIVSLGIIPAVLYFAVFAVHFSLLNKTGGGDAFMSAGFQKTLKGNSHENDAELKTPGLVGKFLELNIEMYRSNQRLDSSHPYGSRWYTWPFMTRPIYYWVKEISRIYLFGNPAVWWMSTIAVLTLAGHMLTGPLRRDRTAWILLGAFVLNLLPFVGITRVMFLYHYLTALVFAIIMLGYLIQKFSKKPNRTALIVLALSLVSFVYFAPLMYGLPLGGSSYQNRLWLKSWQ